VQLMTGAYGESYFANGVAMARTPPATQAQRGKNKGYYGKAYVRQFSGMSRQDYVLGEFHLDQPLRMRPGYVSNLPPIPHWPRLLKEATRGGITWQRQILFIKGASAADVCYFLFRDTVTDSGQWVMGSRQPREPTMWTMWTRARGQPVHGARPFRRGRGLLCSPAQDDAAGNDAMGIWRRQPAGLPGRVASSAYG